MIDIEGSAYTLAIMISGGIGITTLQCRYNTLINQRARGRQIDLCWFIWAVRCVKVETGSGIQRNRWRSAQDLNLRRLRSVVVPHQAMRNDFVPMDSRIPASFQPMGIKTLSSSPLVAETQKALNLRGSVEAKKYSKQGAPLEMTDASQNNDFAQIPEIDSVSGDCHESDLIDRPFDIDNVCHLHTEFYLTGEHAASDLASVCEDAKSMFHVGRPDLDATFKTMAAIAKSRGKQHVAVMTRGPYTLTKYVKEVCNKYTTNEVKFEYEVATFEV
jgi:hypothetical protein